MLELEQCFFRNAKFTFCLLTGGSVGGAASYLQLVVVCLAAAVRLLGHFFVGVKQEADAAVIAHLYMFNT